MRIREHKGTTKDGSRILIRSLTEQDAEAVLEHLRQSFLETEYLSKYEDEMDMTQESERKFLKILEEGEMTLMLGAFESGELAATVSLIPISALSKMKHRGGLGISVKKRFWGRGIGNLLLQVILAEAKWAGYEQVELEVVSENERAVRLYEKSGFAAYGRRPCAVKLRDGRYMDEILMYVQLHR
ncbi:MAG: GNAT family N-acetyltransferase [Clostridiales bacterium]|nr:GNAT family N-acetyltransferase [Clostridiales bacterium]